MREEPTAGELLISRLDSELSWLLAQGLSQERVAAICDVQGRTIASWLRRGVGAVRMRDVPKVERGLARCRAVLADMESASGACEPMLPE